MSSPPELPPLPVPCDMMESLKRMKALFNEDQMRERDQMWLARIAALAAAPSQPPELPIIEDVEKLRFIKRVLENFAGSTLEDRVSAHQAVRDLFERWHAIGRRAAAPSKAEPRNVDARLESLRVLIRDDTPTWAPSVRNLALKVIDDAAAPSNGAQWRCFHCDEVFTEHAAALEHFGSREMQDPDCTISIKHVRWLEEQHRLSCEEITPVMNGLRGLAGEHEELRRRAEEQGYARGLADVKKHPEELGLTPISAPSNGAAQEPDLEALCEQYKQTYANICVALVKAGETSFGSPIEAIQRLAKKAASAPSAVAAPPSADEVKRLADAEAFVRDLLWNQHPECCGRFTTGAEYMGSREEICCGNPDPAELNDTQIVASLRERFPDALCNPGEAPHDGS